MTYPFSKIIIIYNPNSTGDSESNAKDLAAKLEGKIPAEVETIATEHAGHGEEIASKYSASDTPILLVSSSGDGGYNEVINGVLKSDATNVTTMVLPSGNANDHHHATAGDDFASRIINPKVINIDALKLSAQVDGKPWQRYAHSYVGIGLTAYIGKKLTEAKLNPVNEKLILIKYLLRFRSVTVKLAGEDWHHYSSIIFGNIDRMSKVLTLGEGARPDDGKFEVYATRSRSIWAILRLLIVGSASRIKQTRRTDKISFVTEASIFLQCDGEVSSVDSQSSVEISIAQGRVKTLA